MLATVGEVMSKVTLVPSVVAVTCKPAFPVKSVKSIVKGTIASASELVIVYVAVKLLPPPTVTVAECVAIVTTGVFTGLDVIKLKVTTLPMLAKDVLLLLEVMLTGDSVG